MAVTASQILITPPLIPSRCRPTRSQPASHTPLLPAAQEGQSRGIRDRFQRLRGARRGRSPDLMIELTPGAWSRRGQHPGTIRRPMARGSAGRDPELRIRRHEYAVSVAAVPPSAWLRATAEALIGNTRLPPFGVARHGSCSTLPPGRWTACAFTWAASGHHRGVECHRPAPPRSRRSH